MKLPIALALLPFAAFAWPDGTITRSYTGTCHGAVAGVRQTGAVQADITGTEQAFANPAGTSLLVRARFTAAPALVSGLAGRWSNVIKATVTAEPFRAVAAIPEGGGVIALARSPDWSTLTIEATGTVSGIDASIFDTVLTLTGKVANVAPPPPIVTNAPEADVDSINPAKFVSSSKHSFDPAKTPITRILHSARIDGGNVRLSFDPLNWRSEGTSKTVDGGVIIAWADGDHYFGGHFDWHGVGQTVKTLGNIPAGYLDGHVPPHGATVWFCLVDLDHRERTAFVKSDNNWP